MEAMAEPRIYTIRDIYDLPDGERAELIDGDIYFMAPPATTHQRLVMSLAGDIRNYILSNRGTCEVFIAPFGVFLNKDDLTFVEPDISVVCDPDKIDEKGCHGAPDWVVEVVSPGSRQMDYYIKNYKYHDAGVREYWIVDPDKRRVMVYDFQNGKYEEYSFGEEIPAGIYEDFRLTIGERQA